MEPDATTKDEENVNGDLASAASAPDQPEWNRDDEEKGGSETDDESGNDSSEEKWSSEVTLSSDKPDPAQQRLAKIEEMVRNVRDQNTLI